MVWSDGVIDDAEAVDFHVERVTITDVAAEEVFVFQRLEEALDDAIGLRGSDPSPDVSK